MTGIHVSLHKGFKIRLAGIVPVSLEFTDPGQLFTSSRLFAMIMVYLVTACNKVDPRSRGCFTLPIILCKHAYCIYATKCVMTRYKLVRRYTYDSTGIICMFAKTYGKSETFSFRVTLYL